MERESHTTLRPDTEDRLDHLPKVADAFKSGVAVSILTWSGKQLGGAIADRDQAGLLLDLDDESDGAGGYVFVPWSSVEQVDIPAVAHRRVKTLQS